MLPPPHRLTSSQDFSAVMRARHRSGSGTVVVNVQLRPLKDDVAWRCGFIVSKAVGNAVIRHRTTRRLRHILGQLLGSGEVKIPAEHRADIVVRALDRAPEADQQTLLTDVKSALVRALRKAETG